MSYPHPASYGGPPYQVPVLARYKPLRTLGIATMVLIIVTTIGTCLQVGLTWASYDTLETDLAEAVNDSNTDGLVEALQGTFLNGMLSNLTMLLWLTTGVVFLVWLWQARENTEVLSPTVRHRLAKGWALGSWFCPGVQFWFPMTIVDDVYRASAEPGRPGVVSVPRGRAAILGWWAAWAFYWLFLLVSIPFAMIVMISWFADLIDASDAGRPVDDVTIRNDIVRFVKTMTIGSTVAAGLLVIAAALICLVIWRISRLQDARGPKVEVPGMTPMPIQPGRYEVQRYPGYAAEPPPFPSYGRPQDPPPPMR